MKPGEVADIRIGTQLNKTYMVMMGVSSHPTVTINAAPNRIPLL